MPKRTDISSILIVGTGPIALGQAAKVDHLERWGGTCRVGKFVDRLK